MEVRSRRWVCVSVLLTVISLLSCLDLTSASLDKRRVTRAQPKVKLDPNRQPALYTQSFGDCLGGSLLDITRFDAAYYKDNMTVIFHLQGESLVTGTMLLMQIGVFAYGEPRFNLLFNPCNANINSLCPTNVSVPVEASGLIPVSEVDVAGIPPIALSIPDFEGQAILRIFSNSTESEIGCYSAVVTNGNSFSHPQVIGPVVGIFVFVALVASFATAIYGDHVPTMRTHYAHSLSVLVVFAVLQHVFFTGALSMNWPSVLPSFWSNFAWASGMIYSKQVMNSVNDLLGIHVGNTSVVGAAALGASDDTGGGYQIQEIYRRSADVVGHVFGRAPIGFADISEATSTHMTKRSIENATTGFEWYGVPVIPGLPLPGNFTGFPGTLAAVGIPASNAFLTGFIWLLIILAAVLGAVVAFKWTLEVLIQINAVKRDRMEFFRKHWIGYTALAGARTFLIGLFMMMFLTIFQFVYGGSGGVVAVAALVFIIFVLPAIGFAGLACYYRLRFGHFTVTPDRIHLERTKQWVGFRRAHLRGKDETVSSFLSLPWWRIEHHNEDPQREPVHEDEAFIKRYGWLTARFRSTRWWVFALWLFYELVRACFYGGAAGYPKVQVFGLLVVEAIAFIALVKLKPFESNRLNALMIYLLGFSKVLSVALSAAFIAEFSIPRIEATVIGVVIIVIQGFLLLALVVCIILGAMSTRMSLTRNREIDSHSKDWSKLRARYFEHLQVASADRAPEKPAVASPRPNTTTDFNITSVRRMPKIEDDGDNEAQNFDPYGSRISLHDNGVATPPRTRAASIHSTHSYSNLPYGARPHRASWSSRDFKNFAESQASSGTTTPSGKHSSHGVPRIPSDSNLRGGYGIQPANRPASRPSHGPIEVRRSRASTLRMNGSQLPPRLSEEIPRESTEDEITTAPKRVE